MLLVLAFLHWYKEAYFKSAYMCFNLQFELDDLYNPLINYSYSFDELKIFR